MESFYFKNTKEIDDYILPKIEYRILLYKNFFEEILTINDLIIHYEDINIFRNEIVNYVSNNTKTKIINKEYQDIIFDNPKHNFLRSSKTYEEYNYIKEKVSNSDLSKCYNIYNKLLKSCKKFN